MKLKTPKVLPKLELEVENPIEENTRPIVDGVELEDEDDTIFYASNPTDEDWTTQWNKVKYTFPAQRRTRMAIHGATPEEVQAIRKMFAVRFATEQYYKTKEFAKRNEGIVGQRPVPYSTKVLQPWVNAFLTNLPKANLKKEKVESYEDEKFTGDTKPLDDTNAPYDVFKNAPVKTYGQMSDN